MSYAGGQQNSKNTGTFMMRSLLLATALLTLAGTGQAAQPKGTPLPDITIYHLEGRRSERIVWLMEELGLPYDVVSYQRDAKTRLAPPELKAARHNAQTTAEGDSRRL